MAEFLDWKSCQNCKARYLTEPRRAALDTWREVPGGFRVAFHLCDVCAQQLRAYRSEIWGWLIPAPGQSGPWLG